MNPVEIEQAVSDLAETPFDAEDFAYAFLEAFDRKPTEIKRLRSWDATKSDLAAPTIGVLQRSNIHIGTCPKGDVSATLAALKESAATARFKARFLLAADGEEFQAEDPVGGETVTCACTDFPEHFVFRLLASRG